MKSWVPKVLLWGGITFAVLFIAYRPAEAAEVVRAVAGGLGTVLTRIWEAWS